MDDATCAADGAVVGAGVCAALGDVAEAVDAVVESGDALGALRAGEHAMSAYVATAHVRSETLRRGTERSAGMETVRRKSSWAGLR